MQIDKHAFLITAYRDYDSLWELVNQIESIPWAGVFLAVDSRQGTEFTQRIAKLLSCKNLLVRYVHIVPMYWGGGSHYKALIKLMDFALHEGFTRFHTLTGQCRLIYPTHVFIDFFQNNKNYSFIEYSKLPTVGWANEGGLGRIKYYHLHDFINLKSHSILRALDRICVIFQKIIGVNRLRSIDYYGGSGYYSITRDAAKLLVENWELVCKEYNNKFCSEEIAPQTALCNSDLMTKNLILNYNLRYVSWRKKHGEMPAILDGGDFKNIVSGKYLFVRKIDSRISRELHFPLLEEFHKDHS